MLDVTLLLLLLLLLLMLQDAAGQAAASAVLESELGWLLQHMDAAGPFALSGQLSLVDCAVVPFLLRLYILEHYRGFQGNLTFIICQQTCSSVPSFYTIQ
jgi:glutathione S-transferase